MVKRGRNLSAHDRELIGSKKRPDLEMIANDDLGTKKITITVINKEKIADLSLPIEERTFTYVLVMKRLGRVTFQSIVDQFRAKFTIEEIEAMKKAGTSQSQFIELLASRLAKKDNDTIFAILFLSEILHRSVDLPKMPADLWFNVLNVSYRLSDVLKLYVDVMSFQAPDNWEVEEIKNSHREPSSKTGSSTGSPIRRKWISVISGTIRRFASRLRSTFSRTKGT